MLVLGEKAHANGLGESLLLRLHNHYQCIFAGADNNPYTGQNEIMYMVETKQIGSKSATARCNQKLAVNG